MIPAPANTFLKKEGLQIAEASFRDYPPLANQKRLAGKRNRTEKGGQGVQESETVQKKADFVCICPAVSKFAL